MLLKLLFILASTSVLQSAEKPLATLPKDIRPAQVIVSPDQSHFGWIAKDEDSIFLVVDGQKQKPYDWIVLNRADFTADSQHIVYAARKRRKAVLVVDGNESELTDSISEWITSAAGHRIAYSATHNGRAHTILDDAPGPSYDFVQLHALSGGGVLAYMAVKSAKQMANIDGNEGKAYDLVSDIRLSADGKHFAYIATSNGQTRMIIDNQPG